jgi:hypothetical protein
MPACSEKRDSFGEAALPIVTGRQHRTKHNALHVEPATFMRVCWFLVATWKALDAVNL